MTIKRLLKLIATLLLIAAGVIWHYRAPISETLAVWYDNEVGYSCQVVRVMHEMSDIHVPTLPTT